MKRGFIGLCLTCLVVALGGCDGIARGVDHLTAKAFLENATVTIPLGAGVDVLSGSTAVGYEVVYTKRNRGQLEQEIQEHAAGITTQAAGFGLLLYRENQEKNYEDVLYLYEHVTAEDKRTYVFGEMQTPVVYDIVDEQQQSFRILAPRHLLSDRRMTFAGDAQPMYLRIAYEITAGIEDFAAFYDRTRVYDIERRDNTLLFKGYRDSFDAAEAPMFPPFEMRFSDNLGVTYVGLTFPDETP